MAEFAQQCAAYAHSLYSYFICSWQVRNTPCLWSLPPLQKPLSAKAFWLSFSRALYWTSPHGRRPSGTRAYHYLYSVTCCVSLPFVVNQLSSEFSSRFLRYWTASGMVLHSAGLAITGFWIGGRTHGFPQSRIAGKCRSVTAPPCSSEFLKRLFLMRLSSYSERSESLRLVSD